MQKCEAYNLIKSLTLILLLIILFEMVNVTDIQL